MGSIRDAFKAGCRLPSTATTITIRDIIRISVMATVGDSTRPVCLPKSKVISQ